MGTRLRFHMFLLATCFAAFGWPSAPFAALDPDVAGLIAQVDTDSLGASARRLVGFGTRFIGSDSNAAAVGWLAGRAEGFGYESVRLDTFLVTVDRRLTVRVDGKSVSNRYVFQETPQCNVVVTKPGVLRSRRKIVVGGHYDTISIDRIQAAQDVAPGADDNASGVAAMLEIARVLSSVPLEATVEFVFFGAEELGLVGSRAYVQQASERSDDIVAMLQLDSIGSRSAVFTDAFTIDTIGPYLSVAEGIAQAVEDYTSVRSRDATGGRIYITSRGSQFSDHQSFIDAGYPGIGILQYVDNPILHLNTSTDTLAFLDTEFAAEIARGTLAGLLDIAGFPARSPDFDGDGSVAMPDFLVLVQHYGGPVHTGNEYLDLDRDGWLGFADFLMFAENYGRSFGP
jgi:hypothetical protein